MTNAEALSCTNKFVVVLLSIPAARVTVWFDLCNFREPWEGLVYGKRLTAPLWCLKPQGPLDGHPSPTCAVLCRAVPGLTAAVRPCHTACQYFPVLPQFPVPDACYPSSHDSVTTQTAPEPCGSAGTP